MVYLVVLALGFASQEKAMILVLSILEMKNQVKSARDTIFRVLKEFPMNNEMLKLEKYISYRI